MGGQQMTWKELVDEVSRVSWLIKQVSMLSDDEISIISALVTGLNLQKSLPQNCTL